MSFVPLNGERADSNDGVSTMYGDLNELFSQFVALPDDPSPDQGEEITYIEVANTQNAQGIRLLQP